jgi:uncharacterized protein (TIGR02266 family)
VAAEGDRGTGGKADDERAGSGGGPTGERRSAERVPLMVPLRYEFESILDFEDVQSRNISRTGLFIQTETAVPLGTEIAFELGLVDGFTLLKGRGRVVRVDSAGPVAGLGVEFLHLDESMRRLIERIVEVNAEEGRSASVGLDFSRPIATPPLRGHPAGGDPVRTEAPGRARPASTPTTTPAAAPPAAVIEVAGRTLRLILTGETAPFFTSNPLLNARVGGFFGPAGGGGDPPLGEVFAVSIVAADGSSILEANGKVVAKQDVRIGVRLTDADPESLARLRAAVAAWLPTARK